MSNLESQFSAVFLIMWVFWAGFVIYFDKLGDKLFRLLAEKHPAYYRSIGEPKTFGSMKRNYRAGSYLSDLLFKGIPKNFPEDKEAKSMAVKLRRLNLRLFIFFAVIILFILMGVFLENRSLDHGIYH